MAASDTDQPANPLALPAEWQQSTTSDASSSNVHKRDSLEVSHQFTARPAYADSSETPTPVNAASAMNQTSSLTAGSRPLYAESKPDEQAQRQAHRSSEEDELRAKQDQMKDSQREIEKLEAMVSAYADSSPDASDSEQSEIDGEDDWRLDRRVHVEAVGQDTKSRDVEQIKTEAGSNVHVVCKEPGSILLDELVSEFLRLGVVGSVYLLCGWLIGVALPASAYRIWVASPFEDKHQSASPNFEPASKSNIREAAAKFVRHHVLCIFACSLLALVTWAATVSMHCTPRSSPTMTGAPVLVDVFQLKHASKHQRVDATSWNNINGSPRSPTLAECKSIGGLDAIATIASDLRAYRVLLLSTSISHSQKLDKLDILLGVESIVATCWNCLKADSQRPNNGPTSTQGGVGQEQITTLRSRAKKLPFTLKPRAQSARHSIFTVPGLPPPTSTILALPEADGVVKNLRSQVLLQLERLQIKDSTGVGAHQHFNMIVQDAMDALQSV